MLALTSTLILYLAAPTVRREDFDLEDDVRNEAWENTLISIYIFIYVFANMYVGVRY